MKLKGILPDFIQRALSKIAKFNFFVCSFPSKRTFPEWIKKKPLPYEIIAIFSKEYLVQHYLTQKYMEQYQCIRQCITCIRKIKINLNLGNDLFLLICFDLCHKKMLKSLKIPLIMIISDFVLLFFLIPSGVRRGNQHGGHGYDDSKIHHMSWQAPNMWP